MIDPVTGSLIMAGVGAIGSGLSGAQRNRLTRQQLEQERQQQQAGLGQNYQQMGTQERQFGQTSNLNRQQQFDQRMAAASGVQEQLNRNPLRDRAMFMMQQRAGMTPGAFQPRDFTRGTMPGAGAPTGGMAPLLTQMQTAAGQYQPGMGGMDPSALRAQLAGLQDQSQMPGMYAPQSADAMRYGAERQQLALDAARAGSARERLALQERANRLATTLGGSAGAPSMAMPGDSEQAQRDAARRRLQSMLGLVGGSMLGSALGPIGTVIGGIAGRQAPRG
jgi:hypothetical protein